MTRNPRRLALAGLAVLLLSGCGEGQLRPGAAALVGAERITSDRLQEAVERGLSDPQAAQQLGADRAEFQRQTLSRLINREVLEAAAEAEGVTVSEGDVAAQIEDFVVQAGGREPLEEQAAQGGIAPEDLPRFVRDIVLDLKLGDALTADVLVPIEQLQAGYDQNIAQYDRVRARHILVADEQTARMILEQVRRDPSRFTALAAEFSTDTTNNDTGGDLGLAGRGQFVPEFEQVLFTAQPGSYELAKTQFGWHVIHVVERQTTSLAEATPELRRVVLQDQRQQATQELLRATAARLGINVNPRFGRWDPETGAVAPAENPNDVLSPAPSQAPVEQPQLPTPSAAG